MACPVREKLNGLTAFGSIPFFYLMANARPRIGATKNDSDIWLEPRQTKRVGEGSNPFTNPAHGVRAKAQGAIGVCGR